MRNLLNNIFGISQRGKGTVDEKGKLTITDIISYDLVSNPSFPIDFSDTSKLLDKINREIKRQQLLQDRKAKLNKLKNIQNG